MRHFAFYMYSGTPDVNNFKAKIFSALADPVRLRILEYLRSGEKCVCEIVPYIGISQPSISRHLAILKSCGLVKQRKDGNRRLYSITLPAVFDAIDAITPNLLEALSRYVFEQTF